ncbi:heterokaryon incompatibility protein-domain-containing protein [Xylaria cf. heliscus]|nr:heterokaryon incompatibility protein-domain-containing protein [Xylaria cf. heliscus]
MTVIYEHRPLTSPDSIRILTLQPASSPKAPIQCSLEELDLQYLTPSTSYEALSYVWGERIGTIPVLCHGKQLLVTQNCRDALIHLRLPFKRRRLFIDAICIDQRQAPRSRKERDHQIAIMNQVYEKARRVIIWLGKSLPSTSKLFRLMRLLRWSSRTEIVAKRITWGMDIRLTRTVIKGSIFWSKGFGRDNSPKLKEAFDFFVENAWFTRVWTLQEQILANQENLVMAYDCHQIKYDTMLETLRSLRDLQSWGQLPWSWFIDKRSNVELIMSRSALHDLLTLAYQWDDLANLPIGIVQAVWNPTIFLDSIPDLESTVPQDKIFGIYGIFARLGLKLPVPDSSKSVVQVFEATSREIIKKTASLGTLMLCPRGDCVTKGLPSWVPDWTRKSPPRSQADLSGYSFITINKYDATKSTSVITSKALIVGRLNLRGIILGKVQFLAVSSTIGTFEEHRNWNYNTALLPFQAFIEACRSWCHHVALSPRFSTSDSNIDAVRRTLLLYGHEAIPNSPEKNEKHKLQSFSEWFDLMLYPDCKIYDSKMIKAQYIDPILERTRFTDAGANITKDIAMLLLIWQVARDYDGVAADFPNVSKWATERYGEGENDIFDLLIRWANYALMVLDTGQLARGLHICKEGDIVALLAGCGFPVALRPDGKGNYRFVAPLYVDGVMHGEAVRNSQQHSPPYSVTFRAKAPFQPRPCLKIFEPFLNHAANYNN